MNITDEFHPEGKMADLTLVVEDHKILVSKAVLGIASPVFCALFEGGFQEETKNEIPLTGRKYKEFVEFLRCIYPDKMKEITEENVYIVLPLAHEYDIGVIVKRCTGELVSIVTKNHFDNIEQLFRHINLSETYNLDELNEKCISLASEHPLQQLKAAKEKYKITDNSYCRIVETALKRHELDKADEDILSVRKSKEFSWSRGDVCFKLEGAVKTSETDARNAMRSLRLTERFNITEVDTNVRLKILKYLKYKCNYKAPENMEEFELLPEKVKVALQHI